MRGGLRRHDFFPNHCTRRSLGFRQKEGTDHDVMSATMIIGRGHGMVSITFGCWELDRVSAGLSFLSY